MRYWIFLFLTACSGLEKTEYTRIRRQNCTGEYITRRQSDYFSPIPAPTHKERAPYPWEDGDGVEFPKITKEFFRCKGKSSHTPRKEGDQLLSDCDGTKHGLPLTQGKETVYPILIELMNYLQRTTKKRVIITCGHRCPTHNLYAEPNNRTSKHMIGAEVDFYVQGLEDKPLEVVKLLMDFYQGQADYQTFQRYEKEDTNVSTKPWFNKEIFIKLHQPNEGRDFDNRHPHAYLSVQVRYDRDKKEKVTYSWEKANKKG